ncbi:MAG: hypothetical protein ABSG14_09690 [Verrucomicrobiia bacterium]|jgi:hypothetical protein
MTLCIAAIAYGKTNQSPNIVTISDMMLSDPSWSRDTDSPKVMPVTPNSRWLMMYAGIPTIAIAVRRAARRALVGKVERMESVVSAYQAAYEQELRDTIEHQVLARYGMTMGEFKRKGTDYFGTEYPDVLDNVNKVNIDTDLLLAGFDPTGEPHLVKINEDGREICDKMGFCAIGTGYDLATASLIHNYKEDLIHTELIYRMAEAKFRSEAAEGVGTNTAISTLNSAGEWHYVGRGTDGVPGADKIRTLWEKDSNPPVPNDTCVMIFQHLRKVRWVTRTAKKPRKNRRK